jgi:type IV pilus assembly protein PilW
MKPSKKSVMRKQRGFSLVEVMISITLSLIVLAGVLAVMYSSKVTYNENERVGRLQENGRAAMEIMLRDLRGAGFPGCAQPIVGLFQITNTLANATTVLYNFTQPAFGYEATSGTWAPTFTASTIPNATPGNDIIVVRTIPAGSPVMRVTGPVSPTTAVIPVEKETGDELRPGFPLVISDCENASVFVPNAFTEDAADTAADVGRAIGGVGAANETLDLGATYKAGARVAPITTVIYYVAPNPAATGTSLWRIRGSAAPEEIVPGVQALQARYGITTNGDLTVDSYVTANLVTNWRNVISINFALLVRSAEANSPTLDTTTYTLLNNPPMAAFNDRFQRSLFTTTVALRNQTD